MSTDQGRVSQVPGATWQVGVAVEDATPSSPVAMSGFAARTAPSLGVHDPITARALVVDDTCIVSVDVVGLDERTCAAIRAHSPCADDHIVVTATHTHSGPAVMEGRLGTADAAATSRVVVAAVRAAERAWQTRSAATLEYVDAGDLPVATDRRVGGKPADAHLRAVRARSLDGDVIAWLVSYPCHPVVLGADNRLLTADYPVRLREALESAAPGSTAVFITGTAGDINPGTTSPAAYSQAPDPAHTFVQAERVGAALADAIVQARWRDVAGGQSRAAREAVELAMEPLDDAPPAVLAARWLAAASAAEPGEAAVLAEWAQWAQLPHAGTAALWHGSVSAFGWGDLTLVFLPGEPFLATGTTIANAVRAGGCIVAGYADGCPGYFPTRDAYDDGGYEVIDAHRYYGMAAPFERGSAELLEDAAIRLARRVEHPRRPGVPKIVH